MKRTICMVMALGALAGCGTSPEPNYFDLTPVSGPISGAVTYSVKVRRPFLPDYLDRPDIVRQDDGVQVQIDESHRWAEPLDRMLEHILVEDLRQRLPKAAIMAEDDGVFGPPRVTIALDIQRFNATGKGELSLQARLSIQDKGTHDQPSLALFQYEAKAGPSVTTMAEGLSALAGKLADDIALQLRNQTVKGNEVMPAPVTGTAPAH